MSSQYTTSARLEHLEGAPRDVAQVAQRRRDEDQLAGRLRSGLGFHGHAHLVWLVDARHPLRLSPMSKRTVKRKLRAKKKANHGKKPNCGRG